MHSGGRNAIRDKNEVFKVFFKEDLFDKFNKFLSQYLLN